jgi:hypothetical protein
MSNNPPGTSRITIPIQPVNNLRTADQIYIEKLLEIYKERHKAYQYLILFLIKKKNKRGTSCKINKEKIDDKIKKVHDKILNKEYDIPDSFEDVNQVKQKYEEIEKDFESVYTLLSGPICNIKLKKTEDINYVNSLRSYLSQDPKSLLEINGIPRYTGPGEPPEYTEQAPPAPSAPPRHVVSELERRQRNAMSPPAPSAPSAEVVRKLKLQQQQQQNSVVGGSRKRTKRTKRTKKHN